MLKNLFYLNLFYFRFELFSTDGTDGKTGFQIEVFSFTFMLDFMFNLPQTLSLSVDETF